MIDTGLNHPECRAALEAGLNELGVRIEDADVFITHMHADHLSLATAMVTDQTIVYLGKPDIPLSGPIRATGGYWADVLEIASHNGFPMERVEELVYRHPGLRFGPVKQLHFTPLQDGDKLEVGPYHFECLLTPGHSMGHLCLYERSLKLLIAGDHILSDITPSVIIWGNEGDPLGDYLKSLDRIMALDVDLVLPGHRGLIRDCRGRIQELKKHHELRLAEVHTVLEGGEFTAYEVAARMSWDITCENWTTFPIAQQWFATGEALSHLQHLAANGLVTSKLRAGLIFYSNC